MNKIICITLVLTLFCPCLSVFGANDILSKYACRYDTYVAYSNKIKAENNDGKQILFTGNVYNRTALFEFDLSDFRDADYKGCVLALTVRNISADTTITIFSYKKGSNMEGTKTFVTNYNAKKTGKIRCEFSVMNYIKELLASGETTACFAVKSNANTLTIFSSEAEESADRPSLSFTSNDVFIKGTKDFEYPKVSKEQLAQDLSKTQNEGHPFLFGRKSDFERVKADIKDGNEFLTKQYAGVREKATKYIGAAPVEIKVNVNSGGSYLGRGFSGWEIVSLCAFVYLIEGDEQYADRAYKEAEYFADMPSWGTYQYLDNNQAAFTVALCYDWLYNYLNIPQREKLKNALKEKHLDTILDLFRNPDASKYNSSFYKFYTESNNHAVLDNTSTFIEALAIGDGDDINYAAEIMSGTLKNLEPAFDNMYPDSAWYEGVSYWSFVGPFVARMFSAMNSALGTWYGYEKIKSIVNLSDFQIYGQSTIGYFMYDDCSTGKGADIEKYYFGIMKNDAALQKLVLSLDKPTCSPFLCIWYDTKADYDNTEISVSKDRLFRNTDMAVMRNTWEGSQELYTGMVVQRASVTHGHINSGTIALDALGERWITNMGNDSYSLPGYWESEEGGRRWKYYFSRAEANSCLVINPSEDGGQYVHSEDIIDKFVSKNKGAYTISDLTNSYRDQVSGYKRGLMLCEDRTKVILQDEVVLQDASDVYSFINFYKSEFEIAEDGKSVIIKKGNRKLYMNIICDQPFEISVMNSRALPTSNLLPGNKVVKEIKKIAIHFNKIDSLNLRIELTPYLFDEELDAIKDTKFVPLSEWSIEDGEISLPQLTDLKFDGKTVENFNAYNRCYYIGENDALPQKVEAFADENLCNVTVSKDNENNLYKIIVTDKSDTSKMNTYIVCLADPKPVARIIDISNLKVISPKRVTASSDDGNVPANVLDGNMETRWSANGEQYLLFELSKKTKVSCIAIAFYSGSQRKAYFDLQISEDGTNWQTVNECESCGTSDDFEYFDLGDKNACYVRFCGYGNNTGTWNSISDVKIYGK